VITKRTTDSSLEKINDVALTESLFGRMFGFGDLNVLTASEEGIDRLRMLRDAKQFKKAMIEAKHELEVDISRPTMPPLRSPQPAAPEPAPPPPASAATPVATMSARTDEVADALDRLGDLRDRGLITPEEFDAKKRELLDRL
jgi:Short C-terminal domain/Bacterial PH domain